MFRQFTCIGALAVISTIAAAKGPVGIGKLEIGMSQEAVQSLKPEDGAYLSTPMTPYVSKYSAPKSGEDKFDAQLTSPLSDTPLKAVLTFSAGALKSLYISFGESSAIHDRAKELITSKYGEAAIDNSMKEEQCVYKNGSNFKISSGTIKHKWVQERPGQESVTADLSDIVINSCPADLRYASGAIKLKSMSIGVTEAPKKVVNPF